MQQMKVWTLPLRFLQVLCYPGSTWIFSASRDKTVLMWDLNQGDEPIQEFCGHELVVNGIAVSPGTRTGRHHPPLVFFSVIHLTEICYFIQSLDILAKLFTCFTIPTTLDCIWLYRNSSSLPILLRLIPKTDLLQISMHLKAYFLTCFWLIIMSDYLDSHFTFYFPCSPLVGPVS